MRKNDLIAEIYATGIRGADGFWGDYPAIVPMAPSGLDATAPHLTWDDRPMQTGEATFFEIAGAHRRYQCPQSRTLFLGEVPQKFRDAEAAVLDAIEAGRISPMRSTPRSTPQASRKTAAAAMPSESAIRLTGASAPSLSAVATQRSSSRE